MSMVQARLGAACKGVSVDQGLGGAQPGAPPRFVAIGHSLAETAESFQAALTPHLAEIMGDIPNDTKIEPTTQISEVKL